MLLLLVEVGSINLYCEGGNRKTQQGAILAERQDVEFDIHIKACIR